MEGRMSVGDNPPFILSHNNSTPSTRKANEHEIPLKSPRLVDFGKRDSSDAVHAISKKSIQNISEPTSSEFFYSPPGFHLPSLQTQTQANLVDQQTPSKSVKALPKATAEPVGIQHTSSTQNITSAHMTANQSPAKTPFAATSRNASHSNSLSQLNFSRAISNSKDKQIVPKPNQAIAKPKGAVSAWDAVRKLANPSNSRERVVSPAPSNQMSSTQAVMTSGQQLSLVHHSHSQSPPHFHGQMPMAGNINLYKKSTAINTSSPAKKPLYSLMSKTHSVYDSVNKDKRNNHHSAQSSRGSSTGRDRPRPQTTTTSPGIKAASMQFDNRIRGTTYNLYSSQLYP